MDISFNPSPSTSLGIEMELEVVDAATRELSSAGADVLHAMGEGHPEGKHPKAKHELLESTIEIITGVCTTVAEARRDLQATLAEVRGYTDARNLELMCSGTHPFSEWSDQTITANPRYHQLIEEVQWVGRRLQIFGIHVHVGVRSPEKAIAVANALTSYIPHFLGLSASSPYWSGRDTGLASARSIVFASLPTAGLPYKLSGWPDFERFMTTLVSARAITSIREVWWDIRPHPNFGTVEMRVCDGLPTLREVATVAAVTQCLVEWMNGMIDRGQALVVHPGWIVKENKWRAARHGVDAQIIVDEEGRLVPLRSAIADLVEQLSPIADRLGCSAELGWAITMAERPSYVRQRDVVAAGGTLVDVVDALVAELHSDALRETSGS